MYKCGKIQVPKEKLEELLENCTISEYYDFCNEVIMTKDSLNKVQFELLSGAIRDLGFEEFLFFQQHASGNIVEVI